MRRMLTVVGALLVAISAPSVSSAVGAQEFTRLAVHVEIAPGTHDEVEIALVDDEGEDVSGVYCERSAPIENPSAAHWRCDGIPFGVYTVEVVSAPEGALISDVDCLRNVGREDAAVVIVGSSSRDWLCSAVASVPVLELRLGHDTGPADTDARVVVIDDAGAVVDLDCVDIDHPDSPSDEITRSCLVELGSSYRVGLTDVPADRPSDVGCYGVVDPSGSTTAADLVEVTTDEWYWTCSAIVYDSSRSVGSVAVSGRIAPGVLDAVRIGLRRDDGVDVGADHCDPTPFADTGDRYSWTCRDVPSGVYTVDVTAGETPVTDIDCLRNPGLQDAAIVVIGPRSQTWSCEFAAAPKGVVVLLSNWDGATAEGRFTVTDAAGQEVDVECPSSSWVDGTSFGTSIGCELPEDGTYTVSLDDLPGGYRSQLTCHSLVGPQTAVLATFELGDDEWLWSCEGVVTPPISIWIDGEAAAAVGSLRFELDGPEGAVDVTSACRRVAAHLDVSRTGIASRVFHCAALEPGTYRVRPVGPDFFVDSGCSGTVDAGGWIECFVFVETALAPTAPTSESTVSTTETASTGSETTRDDTTGDDMTGDGDAEAKAGGSGQRWWLWVVVGALVIAAGVAVVARRRFPSGSEAPPSVP